jgi:hypothetical protein
MRTSGNPPSTHSGELANLSAIVQEHHKSSPFERYAVSQRGVCSISYVQMVEYPNRKEGRMQQTSPLSARHIARMALAEKSGGRGRAGPISRGFHAFCGPDLLPPQIRLCVPGSMARSVAWAQDRSFDSG